MTIKKFQGKTEEEAIEKAKLELGPATVIMNVKVVKPKGLLSGLKKSMFEVTAAMEEKEPYVDPAAAFKNMQRKHETVNMAADETIEIPVQEKNEQGNVEQSAIEFLKKNASLLKKDDVGKSERIEERLENLQNILERQLSSDSRNVANEKEVNLKREMKKNENFGFVKVLYEVLIENEVNEKYVNQIMDELEKVNWNGNSVDYILSNIYQKMILKFGQPKPIDLSGKKPKVVFFVGPTGVGKTTTIAKVASRFKVDHNKKVAFLTADTYRIAAAEQLRTYANILDTPLSIVYSADELEGTIEKLEEYDLILVDTAGFSHKNKDQKEDIHKLVMGVDKRYSSEVYLVLSATTKYKDLIDISDAYKDVADYKLIFTKLDETTTYGNILNIKLYSGADISYITNGQNVPDDIEIFNTQKIVKRLLGGR